jgi:hypothetical protein
MTVYAELLDKTPAELRQMAAACYKASSDSFDRCDTDGFLSQWASDQTGRIYQAAADLAENGWVAEEVALFDLDGNLLDARIVTSQYGSSWMITAADGSRRFVGISIARKATRRRAHYEKHGVRLGKVRRRVVLATGEGNGYMLSLVHLPDRDHPEVEIVSTDDVGKDWDS